MTYDTVWPHFTGEAAVGHTCWNCGLQYAIPKSLSDAWTERRKRSLICPACGSSAVPAGPTEADKLRDQLTREKHNVEQARASRDYYESQAQSQGRRAAAARGQVTKIKNRVKNGVCPICKRSFAELHRHMAGQHPDYGSEKE